MIPLASGPLLAAYRQPSPLFQAYIVGRVLLCPFDRLLGDIPDTGWLLDYGCGAGIWLNYLAQKRPGLTLEGVDIDPRKITLARTSINPTLTFSLIASDQVLPAAAFDVITCIDVFYLLSRDESLNVLGRFHAALKPGGRVILKDVCNRPAYKHALTVLQEILAVKLLRFTAGEAIRVKSVSEYEILMERAGFRDVNWRRIDQGYPHPSLAMVGHKPILPQ